MTALYRLVHAEKANHPVTMLCRVLHVTRSSYYAWREGEATRQARQAADDALAHEITVPQSLPTRPTASRASTPSCGVWGGE